jgi:hypothetical protein
MNKFIFAVVMALLSGQAFAGAVPVPELTLGAGTAAVALVAGAVAIIRERNKRD